jgi:hypothetical protein
MSAALVKSTVVKGADYVLTVPLTNSSTGTALDLTGATAFADFKQYKEKTYPLLNPSYDYTDYYDGEETPVLGSFTVTIPNPTSGQIVMTLPGSLSSTLTVCAIAFDLLVILSSGVRVYPVKGVLTLRNPKTVR